jgi:nicotinamidase-related amidase
MENDMRFLKFAALAFATLFFLIAIQAAAAPQTLFQMAGAKLEPARLSNSVLIIIDAQREYTDGALPLAGVDVAIGEIGKLLARARKAGTPVIHVVHKGKGALFNPSSPGFEIVAPLRPLDGETIIEKSRVSSFADTGLEEAIQRTGRKNLIVVGFMTHNCVSSTTRAAMDRGYMPTIVAGATATRDLPDGKGGVVTAATVQAVSLAELADRNAVVTQTEKDIQE